MLVLDDPSADIVLDLNGCGLARETGKYDEALFDIVAGSLRVISKSVATPTDSSSTHRYAHRRNICADRSCTRYPHLPTDV